MIPFIQQAITMGYTAAQVLNYVAKKFKTAAPGISRAKQSGYNDEDILKFLGSKINPKNSRRAEEQLSDQERYLKAVGIKTKGEKEETRNKFIGGAINLGLTGLGAYNMYQGYKGLGQTFGLGGTAQQTGTTPPTPGATVNPPPNAPQTPGQLATPASPMPGPNIGQQIGQQAAQPVANAMQPANQAQIGQAAQSPEMPQQPKQSIFDQLVGGVDIQKLDPSTQSQMKFFSLISDQLESQGKTLQDSEFKNLANKIKKTLLGKGGVLQEEIARGITPEDIKKPPLNPFDPVPIQEAKSIEKGDSVVTEDDEIASVKGIAGNNFLIEENGKVSQVPMESLRSQPQAIKNAKIVFDASKVPEEDRSAALGISIPMPDKSAIINMFHDGNFYLYRRKDGKPIDDSIIKRVIEGQDIPISTGETFMGAWNNEKGDSRGSAAHKELVSMAQDANEPDDPSKPLVFEKISESYTHGYLKEFMKLLKEAGRHFSAKPKKPKKTK